MAYKLQQLIAICRKHGIMDIIKYYKHGILNDINHFLSEKNYPFIFRSPFKLKCVPSHHGDESMADAGRGIASVLFARSRQSRQS